MTDDVPGAASPTDDTDSGPREAAPLRIAAALRRAVLDGEYRPGEYIRQEEVARRLGVSRVPVREALRILEVEGLTVHQPNRGAQVPLLSLHEMDLVYQVRERIEPLVLGESMAGLTTDDIDAARELLGRMEAGVGVAEFLVLDRRLHFLTYRGCRVASLMTMVERLWNSTQPYRREFMEQSGTRRQWVVDAEHRLLLDAVERGDILGAQHVLVGHIRRTRVELAARAVGSRAFATE